MKLPTSSRSRRDALSLSRRLAEAGLDAFAARLGAARARLSGAASVAADIAEHQRVATLAHREVEVRLHQVGDAGALVAAIRVLADGRRRLAHVEAYVTGDSAPSERPPCLFDPAHGPSVTDTPWTTVRYGTRRVPACLQDTALLGAGLVPDARTVEVEGRRVAYWEAGERLRPYLEGYFAGHPLLTWMSDPGTRLPRGVLEPPVTYGHAGTPYGFGF